MYSKKKIFKDIKNIMSHDYAGHIDKKDINNPDQYNITNEMNNKDFEETIQDYLLDFKDGHLWFIEKESTTPDRGFSVRRFEDALYVKEVIQEERLRLGDKITHVDGETINRMSVQYAKQLEQKENERQLWNGVLRKCSNITVNSEGFIFEIELSSFDDVPYESSHDFKMLDCDTAFLKLTDFAEEKPILDIINNNDLNKAKNLIIDVRVNYGGNDEFYFPLLNNIFDRKILFKDLFTEDEAMYTNYTKKNCDLWIAELNEYLEQELDASTIQSLKEQIKLVEENYGKGFKEVPEDSIFEIKGKSTNPNVYILTDYYCGSSGETFISNAKKSKNVTVVGRPTMGIMDYFNVVTVDYGDFEFDYSISKMHKNSFTYGEGIQPDFYIPWTPEHIKEDRDLLYVQQLILERE